jgi:hypothetical protein
LTDLGARITRGEIGPEDLVWTIGTEGWIAAREIPELEPFLPPIIPSTTHPPTPLSSLREVVGGLFDELFPSANQSLRDEFTLCIITAVKPLGHAVHQRLIETRFHLPDAELQQLEAEHPGLAERINACSEIVTRVAG